MRASLLLLAFATLLIATPATNGQSQSRRPDLRNPNGNVRPPRDGNRGGPNRPGRDRWLGGRPGSPFINPGGWHGNHPGHGHGGHWNNWPGMSRFPWWYWYYGYPNYWPYRERYHGNRPQPYSRPPKEMFHQGSNFGQQQFLAATSSPISTPYPYGTDAYAGDTSVYGIDPYAMDHYAYPDDLYVEYSTSPYYEADPVQFSYTPSDIPPRAAVVRPDRETLVSLVVPSQTRMPLYGLVAMPQPANKK